MGIKEKSISNIFLKKSTAPIFKQNDYTTLPAVIKLNNDAMNNLNPEDGFMFFPLDHELVYWLGSGVNRLLTCHSGGKVAGFMIYDTVQPINLELAEELRQLMVERPDLENKKGIFLEKILVAPEFRGRHLGQQMLEQLLAENPKTEYIASSVIMEPVPNIRSLNFHLGQGFEEVALVSQPIDGIVVDSVVLLKEI